VAVLGPGLSVTCGEPVVDSASGVGGKKAMRPGEHHVEAASCGDATRASVYARDALLLPAMRCASEDPGR
jgi:hypothetical protein